MMNVLIFESVCGGGFQGSLPPAGLLRQGQDMLRAVLNDFARLSETVSVYTVMEQRFRCDTPADVCELDGEEYWRDVLQQQIQASDAVLIIAPESEGQLEELCAQVIAEGAISLNCTPQAIGLCADKAALCAHLQQRGIRAVDTQTLDPNRPWPNSGVVKPRDGAGCEDTFVLSADQDLSRLRDRNTDWVWQPWVVGQSISLSLCMESETVTVLAHNRVPCECRDGQLQAHDVEVGALDKDAALVEAAADLAHALQAAIPGLRGYVGVDAIWHEGVLTVLEVNPRLTQAYAGLRRDPNLAATLLQAHGLGALSV